MKKFNPTREAEKEFHKFMEAWIQKDYKEMFDLCQLTYQFNKTQEDLMELYQSQGLLSYEITSIRYLKDSVVDIEFSMVYNFHGIHKKETSMARIVFEEAPYKTSLTGKPGINPFSVQLHKKPEK